MKHTAHSEYGTLDKVLIKDFDNAYISQDFINGQWEELNYLSQPNFEEGQSEYKTFKNLLTTSGTEVESFPLASDVGMDSIYCRDSSIITDFGVIICAMGKAGRVTETRAVKEYYLSNGFELLGEISDGGTIEGGDVAWLDDKTLAVGRTYRTNDKGISQLKALLGSKGVEVIVADLPHYKGKSDVFHLMSILSPVDKDLAVVYSPLMPIRFRELLINRGFNLVEVPDEEFESMGCNVLALAPRNCLMVDGNPLTKARLQEAGAKVTAYKGEEISVKGGGGPTCLTRPLLRVLDV
ncbi:arginine deiminase family protein [Fulvivirga sp.]|uniref:dimethylarginine dimethylaminohydrolase family protein n=1 Tax=Fulvivirga sp. TaxID=1931237 RepID=UPI0032EAE5C8